MIRAVLFDLDGTLLDRVSSVRECIDHQFSRFASELAPATREEYLDLFTEHQRGSVPKPAVFEKMRHELGFSISAATLTSDYLTQYPKFCRGFPGLADTLKWFKDRGLKMAIVTNGPTHLQSAAIEALGIGHLFDAVVISEAARARKLDPRIFTMALEMLGVEPRDSVFVGNHPETDIRGARGAGMRAVWKRDDYWGPCAFADAEIVELPKLREIWGQLG